MDVLWGRGGWRTAGEVHEALSAGRELAYNTALTILVRLWGKGRLERQRHGRAYAYRPRQSRGDYAALRMGEVLAPSGDQAAALSRFLETLSLADRAQLRRMLQSERRVG